jgi:polyhydroxybutyrate depolymerase
VNAGALLAFGVAIAATAARAVAADAGDERASIAVGAATRTYVAHVPAGGKAGMPVVFAFHGHFSNGAAQARLTDLDRLSDADGFIVVYPDGVAGTWNDGRALDAGADDVAFVRALIDVLVRRYAIDPRRIYATGFSNGASFTQYLGCRLADRIAAIAPVSGFLPVEDAAACRPSRAISVLEIGGTADPIEPYAGGNVRIGALDRGDVLGAVATIARWAANAGCAPAPRVDPIAPSAAGDVTRVTQTTYENCSAGASVVLDTIEGGGHAWPGGPQYAPALFIGVASRQLDASRAVVDFFLAHPLVASP